MQHTTSMAARAVICLVVAITAHAAATAAPDADDFRLAPRFGPFIGNPFGTNPFLDGGDSSGTSSGTFPFGSSGFSGFLGDISLATAVHYRTIHGILASIAIVVLFPVGAIVMRIIPGRLAIWIHAVFQTIVYLLYVAAVALGIYLVKKVHIPFGGDSLLSNPATNAHPILGIVVLAMLFLQPLLGFVHHVYFKKLGHRTIWSHLHLWNGRIGITAGMVNGGLGLRLAGAHWNLKAAYIAVAVTIWVLWLLIGLVSELRRIRQSRISTRTGVAVAEIIPTNGRPFYAARLPTGRASHTSQASRTSHASRSPAGSSREMAPAPVDNTVNRDRRRDGDTSSPSHRSDHGSAPLKARESDSRSSLSAR